MLKDLVMKFHRFTQGVLLSGKTGSPFKLPVWSRGWNTFSCTSDPVLLGSKAIVKRSIQQQNAWAPFYHPSFQWTQLFQLCMVNCHRTVSLCYAVEDLVHRFLCLHHFSHLPRTTLTVSIPCINMAVISVVYQHIFCCLMSLYLVGQDLPRSDLLVMFYSEYAEQSKSLEVSDTVRGSKNSFFYNVLYNTRPKLSPDGPTLGAQR